MFDNIWTPNGTTITKRYVASLDVLGFKQRLAAKGLSGLFDEYKALQTWTRGPGTKFTVHGTLFGETVGVTKQAPYLFVSDGILLWCDEDGDADSFIRICTSLLGDSVRRGLPMRGAIAFGETIIDPPSSTYLGQPLVDAYLTEQSQEWVGAAIHPSAVDALAGHEDVAAYEVPTKPGTPDLRHALLWHHYMQAPDALKWLDAGRNAAGNQGQKYEAAKAFVEACPLE